MINPTFRPGVHRLEDRTVPARFTVALAGGAGIAGDAAAEYSGALALRADLPRGPGDAVVVEASSAAGAVRAALSGVVDVRLPWLPAGQQSKAYDWAAADAVVGPNEAYDRAFWLERAGPEVGPSWGGYRPPAVDAHVAANTGRAWVTRLEDLIRFGGHDGDWDDRWWVGTVAAVPVVTVSGDLTVAEGQAADLTLTRAGGDLSRPLDVTLSVDPVAAGQGTVWVPDGSDTARESGTVTATFAAGAATATVRVAAEADIDATDRRLSVRVADGPDKAYAAGTPGQATVTVTERPGPEWQTTFWSWNRTWRDTGGLRLDAPVEFVGHPDFPEYGPSTQIAEWPSEETDAGDGSAIVGGEPPDPSVLSDDVIADGWDRLTKRAEGDTEQVYFVRVGYRTGRPLADPVWVGELATFDNRQYVRRGDKFVTLSRVIDRVVSQGWIWQNSGRTAAQWDVFFVSYHTPITSVDDRLILWKDVSPERLISNTALLYGAEARQLVDLMYQTPYKVVHNRLGGLGSYRIGSLGYSYEIQIDVDYRGGVWSRSLRDASAALFEALREYRPLLEAARESRLALEGQVLGQDRRRLTPTEAQLDLLDARWEGRVWLANEGSRAALQGAATAAGVAAEFIPWDQFALFMFTRGLALEKGANRVVERATRRAVSQTELDDAARDFLRRQGLGNARQAAVTVRGSAPLAAARVVEEIADLLCFARDTPVATADGPRPIGAIAPGMRVRAFDFAAGDWVLAEVTWRTDNQYDGPVITLWAGDTRIEATVNHPIWVAAGDDLAGRPVPDELQAGEDEGRALAGRWVNSQDVRVGDVVVARDGRRLPVARMAVRDEAGFPVSTLTVHKHHSFAVGPDGLLAHNQPKWCDVYRKARPVPQSLLDAIDRLDIAKPQIHAHHIVMKGDFITNPDWWTPAQRAYVTDARAILNRHGIDPFRTVDKLQAADPADMHNMCWALNNYDDIHQPAYVKAVFERLAAADIRGRDAVIAELRWMAGELENARRFW